MVRAIIRSRHTGDALGSGNAVSGCGPVRAVPRRSLPLFPSVADLRLAWFGRGRIQRVREHARAGRAPWPASETVAADRRPLRRRSVSVARGGRKSRLQRLPLDRRSSKRLGLDVYGWIVACPVWGADFGQQTFVQVVG